MKIYDFMYNPKAPEGIENKKAYIVGGGIAGLAAAAFLTTDGQMPAKNITIYEQLPVAGGSMDGMGDAKAGYLCRGERELEAFMECLWYLYSKVPSLRNAGRTVLDDLVDFNRANPIFSKNRIIEKCGKKADYSSFKLDDKTMHQLNKLLNTPESEIEDLAITDWFGEEFFQSNLWICFCTMLAFKPYHSLIEFKRYMNRFTQHNAGIEELRGILHTDLNEFDAMIKPLIIWLQGLGVNIVTDTTVVDIELNAENTEATGLTFMHNGKEENIKLSTDDLVFVTNGSMTQNSTFGDNDKVASINDDTMNRGCFTLWERLASKDEKFGHPEKFISDIDKTQWISFFPTITDYPQFMKAIEKMTDNKFGNSGIITIKDSGWLMSIIPHHKPFFPNQPDNVEVFWVYGLFGENLGNYIKKPMYQCTGNEMMTELLYHLGLIDMTEEILSHSYISTCMMPYITSQFMPRKVGDRPHVIPHDCKNLAFIGQYVELPNDVVFTVETSVRTALHAAYGLLNIDKEIIEVIPTAYDMRYQMMNAKKFMGIKEFSKDTLPKINPLKLPGLLDEFTTFLNNIPEVRPSFTGKDRDI